MELSPALMTACSSPSRDAFKGLRSNVLSTPSRHKTLFYDFSVPLATQICEEVKEEKETEPSL